MLQLDYIYNSTILNIDSRIMERGKGMKKIILIYILAVSIILTTSCAKKEVINLELEDQIVAITELLDKNIEVAYEKAAEKPIIFTNRDEYERFAKGYFKNHELDFEFEKYDMLFVSVKKINPQGEILYGIDSITKLSNKVEITIKPEGKTTIKDSSKDAVIENILYIRLPKAIISPQSNFNVIKK